MSESDDPAPGTPAPGTPAPGTPAPGTPVPSTPALAEEDAFWLEERMEEYVDLLEYLRSH